jgi:hypothetical protein
MGENIKTDLKAAKHGDADWIHVALERVQWYSLVRRINLPVLDVEGNYQILKENSTQRCWLLQFAGTEICLKPV